MMYKTPDTIKPLLTPEMSITCLLNSSSTSPSTGLVGRRRRDVGGASVDDLDTGGSRDLQSRSVTDVVTTKKNVAYISSIVLMKSSGEKVI